MTRDAGIASLAASLRASRALAAKADIGPVTERLGVSGTSVVPVGDDCAAIPDGDGFLLLAIEGFMNEFVAGAIGRHVRHDFYCFPENAHCLAPSVAVSSERTDTITRFASSILKALPRRGVAGASSASAAFAKLSDVGAEPRNSCSAIVRATVYAPLRRARYEPPGRFRCRP